MIRRSFRIGLFLGIVGGAILALMRAFQGQRRPTAAGGPTDRWPSMPPPAPAARPGSATPSRAHGDTLTEATPPVATPRPAPVAPEPVVPEPEPEPLHPEPAPSPPMPGEPGPERVIPEPEPTPILPEPGEATSAAAPSEPVVKKAAPRKAATKKAAKKAAAPPAPWVEPVAGVCPDTHPIKGKLTSRLFHLPGMFAYDRCNPDRCYSSEEAATEDGLTKAKR